MTLAIEKVCSIDQWLSRQLRDQTKTHDSLSGRAAWDEWERAYRWEDPIPPPWREPEPPLGSGVCLDNQTLQVIVRVYELYVRVRFVSLQKPERYPN